MFIILTREPRGDLAEIYDRIPVMIPEDKITEWITPENDPAVVMPYVLTDGNGTDETEKTIKGGFLNDQKARMAG